MIAAVRAAWYQWPYNARPVYLTMETYAVWPNPPRRRATALRFTAAVSRGLRESAIIALAIVALVLLHGARQLQSRTTRGSPSPAAPARRTTASVSSAPGWRTCCSFSSAGRPSCSRSMLGARRWRPACSGTSRPRPARAPTTAVRIAGFLLVLVASCALDDAALAAWRPAPERRRGGRHARAAAGSRAGLNLLGRRCC